MKYFAEPGIGQCAVPFFFIASGFFLAGHMCETDWWNRECKKRVRMLLVPCLFVCILLVRPWVADSVCFV